MAYEVTCVTKDSGSTYDDCRCIKTIGYNANESRRTKTPAQMYDKIKKGQRFYILHNGSRTYLEKKKRSRTKYVRTKRNDTKNDNLLKQQSC